jgi:hypothetical protein
MQVGLRLFTNINTKYSVWQDSSVSEHCTTHRGFARRRGSHSGPGTYFNPETQAVPTKK